jgi:drug/metabolite transporter (DMT)-like permease
MLCAVTGFGCLDAISKYLVAHYPAPSIVWMRSVLQTAFLFVVFAPSMGRRLLRSTSIGLQLLRGAFFNGSAVMFVVSLAYMPIAEVAAIAFISPVLVGLAAWPLLGERPNRGTWLSLAGGFAGVLLIIRPGGALFAWTALLPLVCAFCIVGYQILTRRLAGHDHPITTLFYPGLIGVVALPLLAPASLTAPTDLLHAGLVVAIGIFGGVGHFLLIKAHALAPASTLAPLMYAQLLVVTCLGWLVFGQLPDAIAGLGMLLVAASGLYLIFRSRTAQR